MKTRNQNIIRNGVDSKPAKRIPKILLKEVKQGILSKDFMMPNPPYD